MSKESSSRSLLDRSLTFTDLALFRSTPSSVLDVSLISDAFALITQRMLLLTAADLELLADDSEEWVIAETAQNEQWTYNLRVSRNFAFADPRPLC